MIWAFPLCSDAALIWASNGKDEDYKEYKVSGYLTEIHFIDYQEWYDMG